MTYHGILCKLATASYFLFITALGIVLSAATTIKTKHPPTSKLYTQIYLYYMYGLSITQMVILIGHIRSHMHEMNAPGSQLFESKGINFFMRAGTIGFTIGISILYVIIYAEPIEAIFLQCKFEVFATLMVVYVLDLVFSVVQTFFIFKYHKLTISINTNWTRLIFAHLISTNLIRWSFATFTEAITLLEEHDVGDVATEMAHVVHISGAYNINETRKCTSHVMMSIRASRYLMPCVVEYSLVGAGIMFKFLIHCGERMPWKSVRHNHKDNVETHNSVLSHATLDNLKQFLHRNAKCSKSHSGFFIGLALFTVFLVFVIVASQHNNIYRTHLGAPALFYVLINTLLCLIIITFLYVAVFRHFTLVSESKDAVFILDTILVCVTAFSALIFYLFGVVGTIDQIQKDSDYMLIVLLMQYLARFILIVLQSGFMIDALQRHVTRERMHSKPGRSLITLMIFLNFMNWFDMSIRGRYTLTLAAPNLYYGKMAWLLVVAFFLPLMIFFNFHSTVIFAEIWHHSYIHH